MEKLIRRRSSKSLGAGVAESRAPGHFGLPLTPATDLIGLNSGRFFELVVLLIFAFALGANAASRDEPTVDELKGRIAAATVQERAHLCVQIAQKQLDATEKLYAGAEVEQAQEPLTDVVAYSELARDYSIQSRKYQKQTEIAVREMTRKLNGILHTLGRDEQAPVKDAVSRLEKVRDDLLASMFKKGGK